MAKKPVIPIQRYSTGDQCLIALLSEPVKSYKIKETSMKKIKKSEELLRSIIYNELIFNAPISSSSSTA
ncbi:unnamed protein product [Rotaria sordida]|uniref:Uncharacterized protein n=1 Tax=Rotaria sordida TaxID=392033 RepID=A0A814HEK6_9BILA|nr:unnamed protein product [Rotaria sordida]CAF0993581.1 unnamed protein product [Rotaria sordida]CAF1008587.1 unnamed protein product [Rotaria sordida]CAF1112384.1 unnamed protein product [Rotaria sordida]CAF1112743.1 unnamed protein product [Rotaria sordida]